MVTGPQPTSGQSTGTGQNFIPPTGMPARSDGPVRSEPSHNQPRATITWHSTRNP